MVKLIFYLKNEEKYFWHFNTIIILSDLLLTNFTLFNIFKYLPPSLPPSLILRCVMKEGRQLVVEEEVCSLSISKRGLDMPQDNCIGVRHEIKIKFKEMFYWISPTLTCSQAVLKSNRNITFITQSIFEISLLRHRLLR